MSADVHALGEIIWTTSRADESTISATGANVVARAILDSDWLAQRDAAQRAEGAKAVVDAVEGVANLLGYSYDSAQYVAAARAAAARFGVTR
jgi:hypothetical protein